MRLFGPRCAVLLLVRGVASVQPANIILSSRLQRLLSLVPADCPSVADIGCDHALVARTLCKERPLTERVFAVDRSEAALTAALDERAPLGHRQPTFVLGDGLSPLLKEGTVNTLICAGMGCQTTIQILDAEAMSTLSVQRLVLQPWPSYLLPHSTLFMHVHNLGFDFDTQFIDFENSVHYITTSFTRTASQDASNSAENFGVLLDSTLHTPAVVGPIVASPVRGAAGREGGEGALVSEIDVFRRTPLFKRYQTVWTKGGPCEREIQLWKQYLTLQLEDLKMRLRQSPLSVRYDVVEEYHSELTAILKVL